MGGAFPIPFIYIYVWRFIELQVPFQAIASVHTILKPLFSAFGQTINLRHHGFVVYRVDLRQCS